MKRGDLVFVPMESSGKKHARFNWPGRVVKITKNTVTVEFDQPWWGDGTTVAEVNRKDLL